MVTRPTLIDGETLSYHAEIDLTGDLADHSMARDRLCARNLSSSTSLREYTRQQETVSHRCRGRLIRRHDQVFWTVFSGCLRG